VGHYEEIWYTRAYYYIIKQTYEGYACQILHEGKLTDAILVMSGVKQGCILPLAIFLMVMDEVMRKAIGGKKKRHQLGHHRAVGRPRLCGWYLLSHTFSKMETKLKDLENGKTVGLKINCRKTKWLRINIRTDKKFELDKQKIEEVDKFTYLGSMMTGTGGTEGKVRHGFKRQM
jgi:hypothetical protein